MGAIRSYVLAFALGFGTCGLTARFLLPVPVSADASGRYVFATPADVVDQVGEAVVSLDTFPAGAPQRVESRWSRLLGIPAAVEPDPDGVASGVVISGDGYVVTNNHVVEKAGRVRVRLASGKEYDAEVVGSDPHIDLAVLKVPAKGLKAARIGNSRKVRGGEHVVAIGNPLGFENSVSIGVVSAVRSGPFRVDGKVLGDMIQTDAAINQGNSGGGLFTADGELIGINTAIMTASGSSGSIGIGFAIPTHRMRPVVDQLIAQGRVPRPWLGIRYQAPSVNSLIRQIRSGFGVLVEEVLPGSPAERAGLQPTDIVRQLGDRPIRSADDLHAFISDYRPGQTVEARVLRNGEEQTLLLTLDERQGR
jgi:serine protease Do